MTLPIMTDTGPVMEFSGVSKIYPLASGNVTALLDISLQVLPGEFIAIMGPSGSGKSTLLNMMGCLDVPSKGEVYIRGRSIRSLSDDQQTTLRRDELGFIFQQFNLIPLLNALENVRYPLILKNGMTASRERCQEVLAAVGLVPTLWYHRPTQLSGGQQQRVAIARALVNDPAILLCDEPTGNLDTKTGQAIMALLEQLCHDEGKTIIMVTHDPRTAEYADRVIQIEDGRIREEV
ncbi:MAG: ABC transporter ATP-binding protein [Methanospirillum sp.]|uniref:ABC transporter ATP-binding protein n=1 Tax=Methanospirillum sp. TaxID=45200 RepID=UPI0023696FB5|nr:ABC transporter ATP-binding protein [Methanospirillum sp.]MDD1728627.1 ABC transporter ATP-binding protein [Methanospirillum sp.]